jgi:hypothetical protein
MVGNVGCGGQPFHVHLHGFICPSSCVSIGVSICPDASRDCNGIDIYVPTPCFPIRVSISPGARASHNFNAIYIYAPAPYRRCKLPWGSTSATLDKGWGPESEGVK